MAEPRASLTADARTQLNGLGGGAGSGRPAGSEPSPRVAPPAWDFGSAPAAGGRPVTPAVDGSHGWRQAPAPASARQQQQQQHRAYTPGGHATPPPVRPGSGLLRAMRTSSNSLTGLLKRPGSAVAAGGGSPGNMTLLFELRGAAMLPPEPARPATTGAVAGGSHAAASPPQRPATAAHPQQQHKMAGASPLAHSIQARAGHRAGGSSSLNTSPQLRHSAVVAAHGLDLGSSPAAQATSASSAAVSLAQQLDAAAARQRQQQQQAQEPRGAAAGAPPSSHGMQGSSESSSSQRTYSRSSSGGISSHTPSASQAPPLAAPTKTTVHSNPLYSAGSEAYARPRQQRASLARPPPPVRVVSAATAAAAAVSLPHTPAAGSSAPSAGTTPGVSPMAGILQAASNLTIVSDSRPISPGPFLSTLGASSALPDSHSRPVSPQCMDSTPPTPGSFAPLGAAAAATARAGSNLSPVKTAVATTAQTRSQSLPALPVPPAAATAAPPAAAAAQAAPSAAATAFRVPIFNQDGRLVGYKQNSNLIPRPGACISSAPSSPNRSALSTGDAFAQGTCSSADAASPCAGSVAKAAAAPAPAPARGESSEFAEYLADPCRGFTNADNMVPGYVLGPVLGKGGFCSVRKALHELTGQAVACKIIEKGKLKDPKDRDRVDRECRVMRNLSNHVTVVKLFEYVETRDFVYIMMEAAKRGSLLDYVRERKKLPEEEAVGIFQQLLHSLQFCHRKDVVHRDIKLENILIDSFGHMKLIDFGLCGYYVAGKRLRCHCGSPSYAAPEIVARKDYLGPPVDVWSLGIVLFAMLAGYLPFHAKEKKQLSEKILAGVYKPAAWMSPDAQDLISRMLTQDPDQRITLEAVWSHPWVASAPRWEAPGVGAGRLYRSLTDPTTGAVLPDDAVLAQLELLGADSTAIRRALRSRECNSLTASYHLMLEARLEAQRATATRERALANERAAAAAAAMAKPPAASSAGDWQWDFASISAAANVAGRAGTSGGASNSASGSVGSPNASAGSSSLRGSGSPARPRTSGGAVATCSSPTRFGQEAAAAGYLSSPRRHAAAAAAAAAAHGSAGSPLQQAAPAVRATATEWDIKAVHLAAGAEPVPAVAAASEMALPSGLPPIILATAECNSPTAGKSPCLSPMPTVLSPKQLQLVAGTGGSGTDHSPPMAQAV